MPNSKRYIVVEKTAGISRRFAIWDSKERELIPESPNSEITLLLFDRGSAEAVVDGLEAADNA